MVHLPQLCHAIHKFLFAKFTLSGGPEFPCYDQNTDTGWIQAQIITELLDPIDPDFVLVLWVCC